MHSRTVGKLFAVASSAAPLPRSHERRRLRAGLRVGPQRRLAVCKPARSGDAHVRRDGEAGGRDVEPVLGGAGARVGAGRRAAERSEGGGEFDAGADAARAGRRGGQTDGGAAAERLRGGGGRGADAAGVRKARARRLVDGPPGREGARAQPEVEARDGDRSVRRAVPNPRALPRKSPPPHPTLPQVPPAAVDDGGRARGANGARGARLQAAARAQRRRALDDL